MGIIVRSLRRNFLMKPIMMSMVGKRRRHTMPVRLQARAVNFSHLVLVLFIYTIGRLSLVVEGARSGVQEHRETGFTSTSDGETSRSIEMDAYSRPSLSKAAGGFTSTTEQNKVDLSSEMVGSLPTWLKGTLYHTLPGDYGPFGDNHDEVRHWFDPFAMVHAWELDGNATWTTKAPVHSRQTVTHASKFLDTNIYRKAKGLDGGKGGYPFIGLGTPPHPGPLSNPSNKTGIGPLAEPNGVVNIANIHGKFFALTDVGVYSEFDPVSLKTLNSSYHWNDRSQSIFNLFSAAHMAYDFESQEWFDFLGTFNPLLNAEGIQAQNKNEDEKVEDKKSGLLSYPYKLFKITKDKPNERQVIAEVRMRGWVMMHSLGLCPTYVVLAEVPYMVGAIPKVHRKGGLADFTSFHNDTPVLVHLVNRQTGAVQTFKGDNIDGKEEIWYNGHTVNSYEIQEGNTTAVIHDVVAYAAYDLMYTYYLDNMIYPDNDTRKATQSGRLQRCTIFPENGTFSCKILIQDVGIELPSMNKKYYSGKAYTYAYALGFVTAQSDYFDRIVKMNVVQQQVCGSFAKPGMYFNEPLFVAHPDSKQSGLEDKGVILTIAYNSSARNVSHASSLYVLDAQTMTELAHIQMHKLVPFHFHGLFCSTAKEDDTETGCSFN